LVFSFAEFFLKTEMPDILVNEDQHAADRVSGWFILLIAIEMMSM